MTRFLTKSTLGVLLLSQAAGAAPDWMKLARRLSGEGDGVREQTIAKLRRIPQLEETLKAALGEERPFLALDVIVALNLRTLWSEMLRTSEKDRSGFSYLALDALVDDAHEPGLAKTYKERLRGDSSAASKVVILDSLLRMNERLPEPELAPLLLDDPSPEVRSAALYYARGYLLRKDLGYLPMYKLLLEGKLSRQLKAQALALATELPDLPQDVKAQCERLGNPSH